MLTYEEMFERYKNSFIQKLSALEVGSPQKAIWVIKFKGKILKLPSGKSSWRQIGHAKCALRVAFDSITCCVVSYREKYDYYEKEKAYDDAINFLIETGEIQFINVLADKTTKSNNLLERSEVLKTIEDEPEYPDVEDFSKEIKNVIFHEYSVSKELAEAMADCLIIIARSSVKETKKCLYEKIKNL